MEHQNNPGYILYPKPEALNQHVCFRPVLPARFNAVKDDLPRPSYVATFLGAILYQITKNHSKPKGELHTSPWVGFRVERKATIP